MIIIRPMKGLCNRMRAIDAGITLAEVSDTKVHVIWEMNSACNCKFSDLFEIPAGIHRLTELNSGGEINGIKTRIRKIFTHYNNFYIDQDILNSSKKSLSQIHWLKIVSRFRHVFISTYSRFFQPVDRVTASRFIPKAPLKKIINSYYLENMVGVHIRRSDHKEAIGYSSVEGFIKQMKHDVEVDNDIMFFLATDNLLVEKELDKAFPGRIITHKKKSLDRNDPAAIHDAVVDLFCLSNCQKIIGSFWSTFSSTAAELKGLEKVTIRENRFSLKPFVTGEFSLLVSLNAEIQVGQSDTGDLMVQAGRGKILQLNSMSAAILNLCKQSMTVAEILYVFKNKYPEEVELVEENVIEIMGFLLVHNVISVQMVD